MQLFSYAFVAAVALANKVVLDDGANSQVCEGMYSRHDWGGSYKPHIDIRLNHFGKDHYDPKNDGIKLPEQFKLHYVIFEYKDFDRLGKVDDAGKRHYLCTDKAVDYGLCDESQKGSFLTDGDVSNSTVYTGEMERLGKAPLTYNVEKSGYYCVATFSGTDKKYEGWVNFQNAFGALSASEIPKLPAYGILTVCYAVILALFGFQFFKKRKQNQILPLQKYLLAMLLFLTFDTLVMWTYYDLVNRTFSRNWFVLFYMVFLSLLDAAKITFSFFLLLCIALGYGVVVLKLPKKEMNRCKILAAIHFAASMFYLIGSYHSSFNASATRSRDILEADENGSIWNFIFMIPVAITLTVYYVLILASIRNTTEKLHKQRQVIKLQLYQNLFRLIAASVLLTIGGMVLSVFIFASLSATEFVELRWKGAYFMYDFWPSLVFFGVFIGIAWLWRPTEASYMLAVSQQVSTVEGDEEQGGNAGYQQGHEFELDDLSLMSHSDEENAQRDSFELQNQSLPNDEPPKYKEAETEAHTDSAGASNTLFELGDDDLDHEDHEDDKKDKRLQT